MSRSKWHSVAIEDDITAPRAKFPKIAAVYVVYVNDEVYCVGSTANLYNRMGSTWSRKAEDRVLRQSSVVVKYSASIRYGDWLMREIRLIRRLKPRINMRHKPKAPRL